MGLGREGGRERKAFAHDPACWYGHSEFDLALSSMFGGFLPEFYQVRALPSLPLSLPSSLPPSLPPSLHHHRVQLVEPGILTPISPYFQNFLFLTPSLPSLPPSLPPSLARPTTPSSLPRKGLRNGKKFIGSIITFTI